MKLRSALGDAGIRWPAIVSDSAAQLLALMYQLSESETWSADQILQAQQEQFTALFSYALRHSPFYSKRLARFANVPILRSPEWQQLPLLTRTMVLEQATELQCASTPASHGQLFESRTSGSTGQPVVVKRTAISQLLWHGITLRDHRWQQRDASLSNAVIRTNGPAAPGPNGIAQVGWGMPFDALWKCGNSYLLDLNVDVDAQVSWLKRVSPGYLMTYPTNLEALIDYPEIQALPLKATCVGETVRPSLRKRYESIFGHSLTANYSSQELGYIALECPACQQYHVQSESIFLEVLDDDGNACSTNQIGRVVVTDLHNFAMPLVRYEIGDYAEVGPPCALRPGMLALRQVLGRRRNMVIFPDGTRHWPLVGFAKFNDVAPIRQYQFVQHSLEAIEMRLVSNEPLDSAQLDRLRSIVHNALGYPFQLTFSQSQTLLAKTKGGKFEEFVNTIG